jgi:hypothetical protein
VAEEPLRAVDLLEHPVAQHGHALAQRHRLDLIVGDVDRGHPEALVQAGQLRPHRDTQLGVQVRQRLVHQERLRLAHDRAAHRHALTLAAREHRRLAREQLVQAERARDLLHPALALGARHAPQLEPVGQVVLDRHVRVQGVVLEHHGDVAPLGLEARDVLAIDQQPALADVLQARDRAQDRRLAASRGAHEHDELAVGDVEVHRVDGLEAVRIALGDLLEPDPAHLTKASLDIIPCWLPASTR